MEPIVYGDVPMPIYQGIEGSTIELVVDWRVGGELDGGRIFRIHIRKGFIFDGASIPRLLWRICGHPLEAPRIAAALAHDWLYAAHACDRETADAIYLEICHSVGISWLCRRVEYGTLRLFGGSAWRSHGAADQERAAALGSLTLSPHP